jgi:hypothetical protein
MPLEPEDQRHITAAEGYIELGMFLDADEELECIKPDVRHVPKVLALRTTDLPGARNVRADAVPLRRA